MFNFLDVLKAFVTLYGTPLSLGLICFIILCILSIFLVSILTKTSFGISLGFFKINFGNKNSSSKNLIPSLLEYQESHIRNIVEVEKTTLKKQLSYCEQKLQELKFILTANYSKLLSKKLSETDDIKLHRDFRSYQILIGILIKELLDKIFHELLVQNHLEEMSPEVWENYISDKTTYIINFSSDFIDNLYGIGRLVSRQECYEYEKKSLPEIKELLKEIFENVKEQAIQNKVELRKEKEYSENHIKEICKNNGFVLES